MEWFVSWWNNLDLLQQILACVALPATVILFLQTILLLFGLGAGGADGEATDTSALGDDSDFGDMDTGDFDSDMSDTFGDDFDGEIDSGSSESSEVHHGAGLRILTVRGLVAFFAVGGWLGIVLLGAGMNAALAMVLAFLAGFIALFVVALILKWAVSMQENGTVNPRRAIAHTATVYLRIPPNRSGVGKVTISFDERYLEMQAVTASDSEIPVGAAVQVVGVQGDNTLVVRPLVKQSTPVS